MVIIIAMNNLISAMLQEIKVYIIHKVTFFSLACSTEFSPAVNEKVKTSLSVPAHLYRNPCNLTTLYDQVRDNHAQDFLMNTAPKNKLLELLFFHFLELL